MSEILLTLLEQQLLLLGLILMMAMSLFRSRSLTGELLLGGLIRQIALLLLGSGHC